jgi:3-oxoacyl-[acyl-carrier protein] reductase
MRARRGNDGSPCAGATPLGRIGEAGDCVGAFLFLASNELSGFITGNIVHVNGGLYMP